MLGISIYLSEEENRILNYLDKAAHYGIRTVFTSFHIAEESKLDLLRKIDSIANRTKYNNQELLIDISSGSLNKFNMNLTEFINFLKSKNVCKVRLDYGFNNEEIKTIFENFDVILNASTVDEKYCNELISKGINLDKVTVCHNFYPRPETGLSDGFLKERNTYFKNKGFKVQAFIPGDKVKRGPLKEGLPTLERHRNENLLCAYIDLRETLNVDEVIIGDTQASDEVFRKILLFEKERIIELDTEKLDFDEELKDIILSTHINRKDYSELVIRSTSPRVMIKKDIVPNNTRERKIGAITIDNMNYGRYNGEIQIALVNLKADEKVNVLGNALETDLSLLKHIKNDVRFKFNEK